MITLAALTPHGAAALKTDGCAYEIARKLPGGRLMVYPLASNGAYRIIKEEGDPNFHIIKPGWDTWRHRCNISTPEFPGAPQDHWALIYNLTNIGIEVEHSKSRRPYKARWPGGVWLPISVKDLRDFQARALELTDEHYFRMGGKPANPDSIGSLFAEEAVARGLLSP